MNSTLKPSERLMLFLEFLGSDIKKYQIKRMVYEDHRVHGSTMQHQRFADYLASFNSTQPLPLLHRNPLMVKTDWPIKGVNLEDFYVNHPDLPAMMPISQIVQNTSLNEVQKESILYDVFDTLITDYREQSVGQLDRFHQLLTFLPKKGDRYKAPSSIKFVVSILIIIFVLVIHHDPRSIPLFGLNIALFFEAYPLYLSILSLVGGILSLYAGANHVLGYLFKPKRFVAKEGQKMVLKWENKMEALRLTQSGILEEHVHHLMTNKPPTPLPLTQLVGPEKQLSKYRHYVINLHQRADFLRKYHRLILRIMNIIFYSALGLFLWIALLIIGLQGGWF